MNLFSPRAISSTPYSKEEITLDKKQCRSYEDCGVGDKALYLDFLGLSRMQYIPLENITRVYKRLAVSKGFYETNKIYGTLSYLVVCYDGIEKQIRFTHEEEVNALLQDLKEHTLIPVGKYDTKHQKSA